MSTTKNGRVFAVIAAVWFAVGGIVSFRIPIDFFYTLWTLLEICLAVLLFMGKKNIGLLVVFGLETILQLYFLIQYFSFYDIFVVVAYVLFFALILVNIVPSFGNYIKITKFLWFLPSVICFVGNIFIWLKYYNSYNFSDTYIYVINCRTVFAMFFAGLWLKSMLVNEKSKTLQNFNNTFKPYNAAPNSPVSIGEADKLKIYKDLLDSGVITKEEFELKKKQVLGL